MPGRGFKFGTAIGEAAAALVLGQTPAVPLGLFSINRPAIQGVDSTKA